MVPFRNIKYYLSTSKLSGKKYKERGIFSYSLLFTGARENYLKA